MTVRIAVIDDWLDAAQACGDWSKLSARAEIKFFREPFGSEAEAAAALADFEIIVPMRERTRFPRTLLEGLPRLRMLALTGYHAPHIDLDCCRQRSIVVCGSGAYSPAATAELTLGLMIAAARGLPAADAAMRAGRFQRGLALGDTLEGRTLGIVGLGRIGSRVARYGLALGMDVVAWSPNLTEERCSEAGVRRASREALFASADVISLHLIYSAATHGIVGSREIAAMTPGALLVNTARAGLVDQDALLAALNQGRIKAAIDVFDPEPLGAAAILDAPNTVLSPHLGFSARPGFPLFYQQSVENIVAFLDGVPIRVIRPAG